MEKEFGPYKINDRRGVESVRESNPCRVCGASEPHSLTYDRPTMECIRFLRKKISELESVTGIKWEQEPKVIGEPELLAKDKRDFCPVMPINTGVRMWSIDKQCWFTLKLPKLPT